MSVAISVVVPVYNVEEYIAKCIDSLLVNGYDKMELILVDDGTEDSSGDICEEYAKRYPDLIQVIHQENKGLGGARNTGMAAATGEYILFIDSDDFVERGTVRILADHLEELNYPDMLIFNFRWVDEQGNIIRRSVEPTPAGVIYNSSENPELLLSRNCAWNRIVRRSVYLDNDIYFPDRLWYEDLCTTPKLVVKCESVAFAEESLYNYLLRGGSIMNSPNHDRKMEMLIVMDDLISWFRDTGLYETYYSELEFIAISHILLSLRLELLKITPYHPVLDEFQKYADEKFPHNRKNKYLGTLTFKRKVSVHLLRMKLYKVLYLSYNLFKKS